MAMALLVNSATRAPWRRLLVAALCCGGLAACNNAADPVPALSAGDMLAVVPGAPDPSVPSAASVFAVPASAMTAQDAAATRPTGPLTQAQESAQMPMPGQVNNHSTTALDPAKRAASAP